MGFLSPGGRRRHCHCTRHLHHSPLLLLLLPALLLRPASSSSDAIKLCIVAPSLPWTFGPYQHQGYLLSRYFASAQSSRTYQVYWMTTSPHSSLPLGVYDTVSAARERLPLVIEPEDWFDGSHLTFLGRVDPEGASAGAGKAGGIFGGGSVTASNLNALGRRYGIDVYVTIFDVGKVVPDEDLVVPSVAWVPFHGPVLDVRDSLALGCYGSVASLAPSASALIDEGLKGNSTHRRWAGEVEFVPHIVDRTALEKLASEGTEEVRSNQMGHLTERTFVVLLQGGNYETWDRKGWDTSIQSFARFYHSLDPKERTDVHLYIHSLESYQMESDVNGGVTAPPAVLPKGVDLAKRLHLSRLPPDSYTLDRRIHPPRISTAYKKAADVCLHASKAEGFGMNVLEAQALGTPVITTNFTAMGDFTKLGIATEYSQTYFPPGLSHELAMPNVVEIAKALSGLYDDFLTMKSGGEAGASAKSDRRRDADQTKEWIDGEFSSLTVGRKFEQLFRTAKKAANVHATDLMSDVTSGPPPFARRPYYTEAYGEDVPIVDWDTPWTLLVSSKMRTKLHRGKIQKFAWGFAVHPPEKGEGKPVMLMVTSSYEDGEEVPFQDSAGNLHPDQPVLIPTYIVALVQGQASRRSSVLHLVAQHAQATSDLGGMKQLPAGMAIVQRQRSSDGGKKETSRNHKEL